MLALVVSLSAVICAPIPAAATVGELNVDLRLAPPVAPWPEGLPDAVESDNGTFLPRPLADAVMQRLVMLDNYPAQAQARLDGLDAVHRTQMAAAVDVARAEGRAAVVKLEAGGSGWRRWVVPIVIAGVGIAAGAAGLYAGMYYESTRHSALAGKCCPN